MANIAAINHSGYVYTQSHAQAVAMGTHARLVAIEAEGRLLEDAPKQLAAALGFGTPQHLRGISLRGLMGIALTSLSDASPAEMPLGDSKIAAELGQLMTGTSTSGAI